MTIENTQTMTAPVEQGFAQEMRTAQSMLAGLLEQVRAKKESIVVTRAATLGLIAIFLYTAAHMLRDWV